MSAAASAGATKSWFFVALFFLPLGCRVAIFTDRNVEISFIAIGNGSSHQHKAQKRSADPCHVDIICGWKRWRKVFCRAAGELACKHSYSDSGWGGGLKKRTYFWSVIIRFMFCFPFRDVWLVPLTHVKKSRAMLRENCADFHCRDSFVPLKGRPVWLRFSWCFCCRVALVRQFIVLLFRRRLLRRVKPRDKRRWEESWKSLHLLARSELLECLFMSK